MAGVNKVILIGNLGRDPELRYTQGGTPVCRLNIATTRRYQNRQTNEMVEETEWHRVTVWSKAAEHCNNYLSKGRQVYIEGRLRTSSYEDKDGVKKYSTEVIADTVQFLGGRGGQEGAPGHEGGGPALDRGAGEPSSGGGDSFGGGGGGGGGFSGPEDDDIPF
ncbi:MAG: single-stranded DNA-binding protein [Myxococcales bacterium FL481]|nr:MAG: single-stranded DNA-binding protein [Myxococcales bacterium FL481]